MQLFKFIYKNLSSYLKSNPECISIITDTISRCVLWLRSRYVVPFDPYNRNHIKISNCVRMINSCPSISFGRRKGL